MNYAHFGTEIPPRLFPECNSTSSANSTSTEDDEDDPSEDLILSLRSRSTKAIRTKLTRTGERELEALVKAAPTIAGLGWEERRIMRINEI